LFSGATELRPTAGYQYIDVDEFENCDSAHFEIVFVMEDEI
jgi:hypothetical protein